MSTPLSIDRTIRTSIEEKMFRGKAIILYGARQVGKTTLAEQIRKSYGGNSLYLNCDDPHTRDALINRSVAELRSFLGDAKLVVIDEAQHVMNIGMMLKLIVDSLPDIQVIATGSSSFDLSNKIVEPLTGRAFEYLLHPFSLEEISSAYDDAPSLDAALDRMLIYGMYPGISLSGSNAEEDLTALARNYLFKDALEYQRVKNPRIIEDMLKALAYQIGNEVSVTELGNLLGIHVETVLRYIDILEKAFVIFRLHPLKCNLRTELGKLRKVYFYDNGIRNALIGNFDPPRLRPDKGALWENFMISERQKFNHNRSQRPMCYFWRTHQKQEIDYVEEKGGKIKGYEFKWQEKTYNPPETFLEAYNGSSVHLVHRKNYRDFLL